MSNLSLADNTSQFGVDPSDTKRELAHLRREAKKLSDILLQRDKELEGLRKENFNLINRCRNTLASMQTK